MKEKFWIYDFSVLYRNNYYLKFYPHSNMTRTQQLNAITRLCIYLLIIFLIFVEDVTWLYLPIIIIIITIVIHKNEENFQSTCKKPTSDNPYMNYLMSDYTDDDNEQEACDITDENIQSDIKDEYYSDLYRNTSDLFETHNSERQFYTLPNTTLYNDQDSFAKWLFNDVNNCKKDNQECLQHEDIRYV